jgi:hypothetical protein
LGGIFLFDKLAVTKATKLYREGKLSGTAYRRLLEKSPVKDTLHNRINARALRASKDMIAKGPMTTKKYLNASKVNVLPTNAPITMGERTLKHMGRENSKILAKIKELSGKKVRIKHWINQPLGGVTLKIPANSRTIILPKKTATSPSFSQGASRELRGAIATHEISEAASFEKIRRALKEQGIKPTLKKTNVFQTATHVSPEVLERDRKYLKQLSPVAQTVMSGVPGQPAKIRDAVKVLGGDLSPLLNSSTPIAKDYLKKGRPGAKNYFLDKSLKPSEMRKSLEWASTLHPEVHKLDKQTTENLSKRVSEMNLFDLKPEPRRRNTLRNVLVGGLTAATGTAAVRKKRQKKGDK